MRLGVYLWQQLNPMKQLVSLFLALLTLTATAQINYPYNPDENADSYISTPDLMEFFNFSRRDSGAFDTAAPESGENTSFTGKMERRDTSNASEG